MSHYGDAPKNCGDPVIDFSLYTAQGGLYESRSARSKGLLLVAIFRSGCDTCRYSAPYLQRFHTLYAEPSFGKFQIWGVSQDASEKTADFAEEYGLTFPILLDENLQVSEDYAIVAVPDLYLLDGGSRIAGAVVGGFQREGFNALAKRVAEHTGVPYTPVVREEDRAVALKPG